MSRVSPEVVDIPTVETVVEINEKKESQEPSQDDTKDITPPQGRLPPLQPLKVTVSTLLYEFTVLSRACSSCDHFAGPFRFLRKLEVCYSYRV
jgi:hypothetical protein